MEFIVRSKKPNDFIDITGEIVKFVRERKTENGLCCVYAPHTTCGLALMEYEEGAVQDLKETFGRLAPENGNYEHNITTHGGDQENGNGYAHVRAGLTRQSVCIPITDGELALGTWQSIVLIDFDGPRQRRVIVKII